VRCSISLALLYLCCHIAALEVRLQYRQRLLCLEQQLLQAACCKDTVKLLLRSSDMHID
jgi:hypothetical protein